MSNDLDLPVANRIWRRIVRLQGALGCRIEPKEIAEELANRGSDISRSRLQSWSKLAGDPRSRPATAAEILEALDAAIAIAEREIEEGEVSRSSDEEP